MHRFALTWFVSSLTLIISFEAFCALKVFQCTIGSDFSWFEAVLPLLLLSIMVLSVDLAIVFVAKVIVDHYKNLRKSTRLIYLVIGGVYAGLAVRFLLEFLTGSFPETFYPRFEYIPFAIAGVVAVAGLSYRFKK